MKNNKKTFDYEVSFSKNETKNEVIPSLWATRRIGFLLDNIRFYGENKELIDEITILARKYGIITPYTSYHILEDEIKKTSRNELEPGFQTLGNILQKQEEIARSSKNDYKKMKDKSGFESVQSSKELQNLNDAASKAEINQGQTRMIYRDNFGNSQNIATQVKNINGRAFYQNGKNWIDSSIQDRNNKNIKKVKFAGNEYFDLLANNKEISIYFALGRNVIFSFNNMIYE